jgi:intracellular septation protein
MDWTILLLDFIPLLVFVVLDSLGKVRYALLGAVLAAALELGYSFYALGRLDEFSLLIAAFVLVFAALSYKFNNPLFFKFKPVSLSALSALVFLATAAFSRPFLLTALDHYAALLPESVRPLLDQPRFRQMVARFNLYLGFASLLHAGLTAWAALRLSRWWWLAISSLGLYLAAFLAALLAIR